MHKTFVRISCEECAAFRDVREIEFAEKRVFGECRDNEKNEHSEFFEFAYIERNKPTGIDMKKTEIIIRKATSNDAGELLKIYEHYVVKTAISFETEVPTEAEFRGRIEKTLKEYPYLVAEIDGNIMGYAYTSCFVGREAYRHSAETSIYVKEDARGSGIGGKLYSEIEKISKAQNILNLYACIGYTDVEDEYLTNDSMRFHEHLGYKLIGTFKKCGYKFDRWYDMIWMEKIIGKHEETPQAFISFSKVETKIKKETL